VTYFGIDPLVFLRIHIDSVTSCTCLHHRLNTKIPII